MRFEDVENYYYKSTNEHINKEKFLNELLKVINKLEILRTQIETSINIAKIVLNRMYNNIMADKNFNIKVEEAKITINILGELAKIEANSEAEKTYISIIIKIFKNAIDSNSRNNWQRHYN